MVLFVVNEKEYKKVYFNFVSVWNVEYLLKDLGRINFDFYFKLVVEKFFDDFKVKNCLVDCDEDYLIKNEFIKVYKKCGVIMYVSNLMGCKIGYEYYKKNILEWR